MRYDVHPTDLLTPRQWGCLSLALRQGYYEIPRECTLADLAARLDVDPSTLNDALRRADGESSGRSRADGPDT